jgi:sugar O-acyltransferase (sialic acid O-acetyltransferase NeuD family)
VGFCGRPPAAPLGLARIEVALASTPMEDFSRSERGLVVWGAKGHALVLAEFASAAGYRVAVLVDNDPERASPLAGVPLVHGAEGLDSWMTSHSGEADAFAIAIGGNRGGDRLALHDLLGQRGLYPATLIHPAGYVASDARMAPGSQVLAQACVATHTEVGRQCIVNTSASVDHECVLADGVHIGPGATLAGCVMVGAHTFVGAGAVVLPNIEIGADTVVSAGAVVTRNVAAGAVVVGVPARPLTHGPQ